MPTLTRGRASKSVVLVINIQHKKQPGLGTVDDDRVARDDRGRHIECRGGYRQAWLYGKQNIIGYLYVK